EFRRVLFRSAETNIAARACGARGKIGRKRAGRQVIAGVVVDGTYGVPNWRARGQRAGNVAVFADIPNRMRARRLGADSARWGLCVPFTEPDIMAAYLRERPNAELAVISPLTGPRCTTTDE